MLSNEWYFNLFNFGQTCKFDLSLRGDFFQKSQYFPPWLWTPSSPGHFRSVWLQGDCICMAACFQASYVCVCVWMDWAESVNTSFNANQQLPEEPHPSLFFSFSSPRSLKAEPVHINFSQPSFQQKRFTHTSKANTAAEVGDGGDCLGALIWGKNRIASRVHSVGALVLFYLLLFCSEAPPSSCDVWTSSRGTDWVSTAHWLPIAFNCTDTCSPVDNNVVYLQV